jgi:TetR/AcrR family transcriptional regulator, transcriptional repressor of aconitase
MPSVSQEHLDARRRQILDAARRCFVRNGFHATSMQDVLAEANLSAGAVYRYFRGKDEIIAAIAGEALAEMIRGEVPRLRDRLARVVRVYQDRGLMAADAPAEQVAQVLVGLLPGFVFQHALLGDVDSAAFRAGLRTLLTTRLDSPLPSPATA